MNEIEKSRITEIQQLHNEIGGYLRMTLDKAVRIGELLQEQKAGMEHGEWLPWIEKNVPFSERTARDYMRFYDRREELKTARVADMADARRLLTEPGPPYWSELTSEEKEAPTNPIPDLLPDTDAYKVTSRGLVFQKMLSYGEWIKLGKKLSHIKLPGEHEYFLIGDWALFGDQMQYQTEKDLAKLIEHVTEIRPTGIGFEDFIMLLAKKAAYEAKTQPFIATPIPEEWDYDKSVKKMRIMLNMLKKHFENTGG